MNKYIIGSVVCLATFLILRKSKVKKIDIEEEVEKEPLTTWNYCISEMKKYGVYYEIDGYGATAFMYNDRAIHFSNYPIIVEDDWKQAITNFVKRFDHRVKVILKDVDTRVIINEYGKHETRITIRAAVI